MTKIVFDRQKQVFKVFDIANFETLIFSVKVYQNPDTIIEMVGIPYPSIIICERDKKKIMIGLVSKFLYTLMSKVYSFIDSYTCHSLLNSKFKCMG